MPTSAVIGAHFGDEGKGLITDWLCKDSSVGTIVVRYNGGAQAGHTVVTPDGITHVFHHIASGTLAGSSTYLAEDFIVNPILFNRELDKLRAYRADPLVFMNPNCRVTTPYDIILNQLLEKVRGGGRHGSCGLGIYETIKRSENPEFKLVVEKMDDESHVKSLLGRIRDEYLPNRLVELGLQEQYKQEAERLPLRDIETRYIGDCISMAKSAWTANADFLFKAERLIFEGAQGLLLGQDKQEFYPHLTPSYPGLKGLIPTLKAARQTYIQVTYVTRFYVTRHGAGPLPNEVEGYEATVGSCPTNHPNEFQGRLRYGLLDLDLFHRTLADDIITGLDAGIKVHPRIAVTHLDRSENCVAFVEGGNVESLSNKQFLERIGEILSPNAVLYSIGPTRNCVLTYYNQQY